MSLNYKTNRVLVDIDNLDIGPDYEGELEPSIIDARDLNFLGKGFISEEDELYDNLEYYGYDSSRGRVKYAGFRIHDIDRDSDADKYAPTISEKLNWPLKEVENIIKNGVIYSERNSQNKKDYIRDDGFIITSP